MYTVILEKNTDLMHVKRQLQVTRKSYHHHTIIMIETLEFADAQLYD